jgi:TPR repeat protein
MVAFNVGGVRKSACGSPHGVALPARGVVRFRAGPSQEAAARACGAEETGSMRSLWSFRAGILAVAIAASGAFAVPAFALDGAIVTEKPERSPWAVFRFGFTAYKQGHKDQAVEAYRYAAENGQIGASWKLARMYAEGDGVARDDYEAFKFFSEIARQDVEPGSPDESYMSDALVALAGYLKRGIPGTPVQANMQAAQDYYMRAAATYRNPNAQYEVGRMFLAGEGVKKSAKQAGRWFQLAAAKGHAAALATLGQMLFHDGTRVRGLAMMTVALERAPAGDSGWIRDAQEEAFASADETERRTAITLAQDMLTKVGH